MNMQDMRTNVAARIKAADDTIVPDILDPAMTQDSLIEALDRITAPTSKDGLAIALEITSLHRDHGDDSALGPHGHAHGFAADTWPQTIKLRDYIYHLMWHVPQITKIGLGGTEAQALFPSISSSGYIVINNKVLFYDNLEPHIHIQTA